MGAGISYHTGKQKNRDYSPFFEPLGEYEYIRVPKILRTSIFTGLQYRKKFTHIYTRSLIYCIIIHWMMMYWKKKGLNIHQQIFLVTVMLQQLKRTSTVLIHGAVAKGWG